jgi:phosphoketolase
VFAFPGYAALIHKLGYRRANHENMHVRGYKEKGSINTPLGLTIVVSTLTPSRTAEAGAVAQVGDDDPPLWRQWSPAPGR